MVSGLRNQTPIFGATPAVTQTRTYASPPPAKKQKKMTVTQTYYLAHTARGKLSSEAQRGDHDLRLLVGHANLLDNLMVELHEAEREQEAWFNQTIRSQRTAEEPQRVQWSDKMATVDEEEDSDADDSDEEIDAEEMLVPVRRLRSPPVMTSSDMFDDEYDEDAEGEFDDDFAKDDLALIRTASHTSPPELVADASDSEDEEPQSPPQPTLDVEHILAAAEFTEANKQQAQAKPLVSQQGLVDNGFYNMGERQQPLISAAC